MSEAPDPRTYTPWRTHIQWKGTDVCLDFVCPSCGHQGHFDGWHAYHLTCGGCQRVFEMGTEVSLTLMPSDYVDEFPKVAE